MPFFDEDTDQPEQEQLLTMGQRAATATPGPVSAPPGAPAPAPAQASGGSPSRFVNFDRFFNANSGAAQGMANQLGDRIQSLGDKAQGGLKTAQDSFNQQVNAGKLSDPGNVTISGEGDVGVVTGARLPDGLRRAPGATLGASGAEAMANRRYTGPGSLADVQGFGDARKQADEASKQAGLLGSQSGVQALQDKQYGARNAGGSRFDAGLTQTAGRGRFDRLSNAFGGMNKQFNNALEGSKAAGDAARNETDAAANKYKTALDAWRQAQIAKSSQPAPGPVAVGQKPTKPGYQPRDEWAGAKKIGKSAISNVTRGASIGSVGGPVGAGMGAVIGLGKTGMEALLPDAPEWLQYAGAASPIALYGLGYKGLESLIDGLIEDEPAWTGDAMADHKAKVAENDALTKLTPEEKKNLNAKIRNMGRK